MSAPDAKIVRGDEHPSGLRDAIRQSLKRLSQTDRRGFDVIPFDDFIDVLEPAVTAWLSVVFEAQIEAAARAMYERRFELPWTVLTEGEQQWYREGAAIALAASREVLIPKETRA